MPIENPLLFYRRRLWEIISTYLPWLYFRWKLGRLRQRVLRDPNMRNYTDPALHPVAPAEDDASATESKTVASGPKPKELAA